MTIAATYVGQAAFTSVINGAGSTTCPGITALSGDLAIAIVASFSHQITPPDSTWTEIGYAWNATVGTAVFVKQLTGSLGSTTWTADGSLRWHGCHIIVYRGVTSVPVNVSYQSPPGTATNKTTVVGMSLQNGNQAGTLLTWMTVYDGAGGSKNLTGMSTPNGDSTAVRVTGSTTDTFVVGIGEITLAHFGATYTPAFAFSGLSTTNTLTYQCGAVILTTEQPPNAPTLQAPPASAMLDRTATNRFTWAFSDPDSGDSQSAFDLRYSSDNGVTWTTVSQTTPNNYWDAPGGTFAAGSVQWQVRTYDQTGIAGPYSASQFFTAATPAAGPSFVAPTNGGLVDATMYTVTWSFNAQQAYELRRVKDNAGSADTTTVYWTSGQVTDSTTRSLRVPFPNNNEYEHLQLRVQSGGLWTAWTDVRVHVSYTPPPVPSATVVVDDTAGTITLSITDPPPNRLTAAQASFEDGTAGGWSAGSNATIVNSTAQAADGTHSLLYTRSNATAGNGYASLGGIAMTAQYFYTFSVDVYGGAGTYELIVQDPSGARTTQTFTAPGNTWTRVSVTATAGSTGTGSIWVTDDPNAAPTSGSTLYIDAAAVRQGSYGAFEPGGQPATSYNDVYVTRGSDSEYRAATNVPPNSTWTDCTPASGVDNRYRVVAVGSNGAEANTFVGGTPGVTYGAEVYGTGTYGG